MEVPHKFSFLFRGLDRAYVRVPIKQTTVTEGKKVEARAFTVHEKPTEEVWEQHIKGKDNLAIIPITDSGQIYFGAIDIDDYQINFEELEKKVRELKLPLVICRSKSGGAHLYLFLKYAIDAEFIVGKLRMFAAALGYTHEIFPKQTKLANQRDTGNGISMPYYGGDATNRYAYYRGKRLDMAGFISLASRSRVSKEHLANFEIEADGEFIDAPPCLQILSHGGIPSGYRNDGMFSFGVLCRKKFGDGWRDKLEEINQKVCSPPLQASEILGIQKSLSKDNKDYFFRCNVSPLVGHCNKAECRKRDYGIGNHDEIPVGINALIKIATEPPVYIVQVEDRRVELSSGQLLSFRDFRKRVFECLDILLPQIKAKQWDVEVGKLLEKIEVRLAPKNSTPSGKLLEHLEAYCTGNSKDTNREILVRGGVWVDGETTYVHGPSFEAYLQRMKFTELAANKITTVFKTQLEATHHQFNILNKCVSCWGIKSYEGQTDDFEVPKVDEEM